LVELMVLKEDISNVLLFLGKSGNFQFQNKLGVEENSLRTTVSAHENREREMFARLDQARAFLGIDDSGVSIKEANLPDGKDFEEAEKIISSLDSLIKRDATERENYKRLEESYKEASAFSNLKQSYGELERLSFLSLRIGKIDPAVFDELKFAVGQRVVVVPLGDDKTRILAASSKKGRFALDTELKKFGFVQMEIPQDFKGIPDEVLASLKKQRDEGRIKIRELETERANFTETHKEKILRLLASFSLGAQLGDTESLLESTQLVYRLTGWIPISESSDFIKKIDSLTSHRVSVRQYRPDEVSSVVSGSQKVNVMITSSKFEFAFNSIIFRY
ncbi:MAG: ATPase, partial [Treponemataceae bacterium]|nr:ATPase [Treponemataceae bacterium]